MLVIFYKFFPVWAVANTTEYKFLQQDIPLLMVPNNIKTQLLYQNKTKTLTKYPILTKLPRKSNQNLVNQSVLYLPTPTETADQ